jgi:hypothetical protein
VGVGPAVLHTTIRPYESRHRPDVAPQSAFCGRKLLAILLAFLHRGCFREPALRPSNPVMQAFSSAGTEWDSKKNFHPKTLGYDAVGSPARQTKRIFIIARLSTAMRDECGWFLPRLICSLTRPSPLCGMDVLRRFRLRADSRGPALIGMRKLSPINMAD